MTDMNEGGELAAVLASARDRAGQIEELRRLPVDLVAALADIGTFRTWVPTAYGGAEADLVSGLRLIQEAARHDGATGWCVMIANTTSLLAGSLPPEHAKTIYGQAGSITGGFAAPVGTGTLQPDGSLRVSGEWAWGSGSSHCTHLGGGVRVVDADGGRAQLPGGGAMPFVFFDMADVELLDTWHVAGLKGTASTDYRVTDAIVPEGRWVAIDARQTVIDSALYRFSTFGALAAGVGAVMLGLAERAVAEVVALGAKLPQGSARSLAERPAVQAEIAAADAARRAAELFLYDTVDQAWNETVEGGVLPDELRARLRLAANHAAAASVSCVDACYTAGGGAAIYSTSPLQRVFRDVHVAAQHAMIAPRVFEPLGRIAFGLETDMRTL